MLFVRLRVPYDAVGTYDAATGKCTYSTAFLEGGTTFAGLNDNAAQDWNYLYTRLRDARADGLIPILDLENATTITDPALNGPGNPQPMAPVTATSATDTSHITQADDYACGVYLLMWATAAAGVPVSYWEAWNEPNYQCSAYSTAGRRCPDLPYVSPLGVGAGTGSWNAAFLWYAANRDGELMTSRYGVPEYVAALTVAQAQNLGYSNSYITNVKGIAHCTSGFRPAWGCDSHSATPRYWAVHDYDDPSWGKWHGPRIVGDLQAFETDLANTGGLDHSDALQVWVTESGTHLEDKTTHDANGRSSCDDGDPSTVGTLGACVDRQPQSQYVGAEIWHSLGEVYARYANTVSTTMVLWYEYALPASPSPWDSAMIDTAPVKHDPPAYFETGRAAYCAVFGSPGSGCAADGSHATDYRYHS
jgi:hypothetical protein